MVMFGSQASVSCAPVIVERSCATSPPALSAPEEQYPQQRTTMTAALSVNPSHVPATA